MTELPTPAMPDMCWPVVLPDDAPAAITVGDAGFDQARLDAVVALATQTLRALTGYRVGGCPVLHRPVVRRAAVPTWRTYPVAGYRHRLARCAPTGESVTLPGRVGTVEEVVIDGATLTSSAYRLAGNTLYRVDGDVWPTTQNLALPVTEPGTWGVRYTPGVPVDGMGAVAAGLLAAEYAKALAGAKCALPSTVTQIARQGVTMTLASDGSVFPDGKTGISTVDAWVHRWNPNGLTIAPTVWSPDTD